MPIKTLYREEEENRLTVTPFPHGCEGKFFCAKHKHQTTACQEETSQGFCRRPRREYGFRWAKPKEEICEASEYRKPEQKPTPKLMDLHLSAYQIWRMYDYNSSWAIPGRRRPAHEHSWQRL